MLVLNVLVISTYGSAGTEFEPSVFVIVTIIIGRGDNGKLKNSLDGKSWTLLIGKTISGIDLTDELTNV